MVWSPDAEQELSGIWNKAADRESVASAANFLDRELARDPGHAFEPNKPTQLLQWTVCRLQ
jgi:hypothetical protein